MGKLPAYLFYTKDWRSDPALCRVSKTARDTWMDMNCIMFDSEERGVLVSGGTPWTDEEIAEAVRGQYLTNLRDIAELLDKGVAFRDSRGAIFCKRMVRDEQERVAAKKRKRESRSGHTVVTPLSPIETATEKDVGFEVDSKKSEPESKPRPEEDVVPEGLHSMSYAPKICEEIGLPQVMANLKVVAASVEAVARACSLSLRGGHIALLGKAKDAIERGETVDYLWFLNSRWKSEAKRVSKREQEFAAAFKRARSDD